MGRNEVLIKTLNMKSRYVYTGAFFLETLY